MKLVHIDDPITFLCNGQASVCDVVNSVDRAGFLTESMQSFKHADEDKTWVRGHHLPDSDAVRALKAAAAMSETPTDPRADAERLLAGLGSNFLAAEELVRAVNKP